MKKRLHIHLPALILCYLFSFAYSASADELIAGPENHGLRMRLLISNAEEGSPDVYRVHIDLLNVGKEPVVLAARWVYEEEQGDYLDFLKKEISFVSFPEVMLDSAQTGGSWRKSPQPECEIEPGKSLQVEWVSAPRRLKPQGYYNTTPTFPSNGLYGVRAQLLAMSKDGQRILLTSNEQQISVGGSTKMPKHAVAHIIECDPENKKVRLDLGSDHRIELNDKFDTIYFPIARWVITIVEVQDTTSTGSVEGILRDAPVDANVPTFPQKGRVAKLLRSKNP